MVVGIYRPIYKKIYVQEVMSFYFLLGEQGPISEKETNDIEEKGNKQCHSDKCMIA